MRASALKSSVVSLVHSLPCWCAINCDPVQEKQHGHWLVVSTYPCKEQNGFSITAPLHTTISYPKCRESPSTDPPLRRLTVLRLPQKVNNISRYRICEHPNSGWVESAYDYPPRTPTASASLLAGAPSVFRNALEWLRSQLPRIEFKDLLPVSMEVEKGAIICGNASTPNLLVAEYKKAEGTYGVVPVAPQFLQPENPKLTFLSAVTIQVRPLQTASECQVPRCFHSLCDEPQLRITHGVNW